MRHAWCGTKALMRDRADSLLTFSIHDRWRERRASGLDMIQLVLQAWQRGGQSDDRIKHPGQRRPREETRTLRRCRKCMFWPGRRLRLEEQRRLSTTASDGRVGAGGGGASILLWRLSGDAANSLWQGMSIVRALSCFADDPAEYRTPGLARPMSPL